MAETREYELVLMLDPGLEDSARDALAQEARGQIESEGSLKHENDWGIRKMAYEIEQRTEADYRWFRFEAPRELLGRLDHSLKIADGVLRFRVFKVDPDSPVLGAPPAAGAPAPSRERGERGERGARDEQGERPRRQERPAREEPAAESSEAEETATTGGAPEEPAAEGGASEEPAAESSAPKEPAAEGGASEEPAAESSAPEESAAEASDE